MNNKLISLLLTGAIVGGVGTSAVAGTVSANAKVPVSKVTQNQQVSKIPTNQEVKTATTKVKSTTNNEKNSGSEAHTALKEGLNHKWIKSQLENNQTITQIKASLIANYKSELSKEVATKKITSQDAQKREIVYSKKINKMNILKGLVINKSVMNDLKAGKTLSEAKVNLLNIREANIKKLVSENKISSEQATKIENATKNRLNKNKGIFINEKLVHEVRQDINSGKTLAQAKQEVVTNAQNNLQKLSSEGKINKDKLPVLEKRVQNRIEHNPAFRHISNVPWVQKALENGQTVSQIKTEFANRLNQREQKINENSKLTQDQKNNMKNHIKNIQKNIVNESIFSNLISK